MQAFEKYLQKWGWTGEGRYAIIEAVDRRTDERKNRFGNKEL
jgi:hypothetical protein